MVGPSCCWWCVSVVWLLALLHTEARGNCHFSLQRIPEYSNIIRTDNNGKSCRGNIRLPFCKGACKTHENGVHVFPYRENSKYVCVLIGTAEKNVTLHDCDEGADDTVRYVTISAATQCGCRELDET